MFMKMFMTETLAKRLVSMVLIAAGISSIRITEATGLCLRSIWALKKAMAGGILTISLW
jgi:hypothetical protein